MDTELNIGISEALDILHNTDSEYVNKIPKSFMEFLEKNKSANYKSNLDHSRKLNELNLKETTKDLLAIIYMNYWCTPEEKQEYVSVLKENEEKYQKELRKKYNPDNIFKNNNQKLQPTQNEVAVNNTNEISNNVSSMIEYKESFLKKIWNKLKNTFHVK